jgi:hypothetical protein
VAKYGHRIWKIPVDALERVGLKAVRIGRNDGHFELMTEDGAKPTLEAYQQALVEIQAEATLLPEEGEAVSIWGEIVNGIETAAQDAEAAAEIVAEDAPPP